MADLVGADHRGQVFGLVAGEGHEQRVVEQFLALDIAARVGKREQDAVDGAVVQRFAGLRAGFLAQEQLERGTLAAQQPQHPGEQEGRDRRDDAHPQFADQRRRSGGGHVGQLLGLAQDAVRFLDDRIAQSGKADDAAGAFDQGRAEQGFELADSGRQGRLGHVARIGGAAEMTMFMQRDKILHLFEGRKVILH